MVRAPLDPPNSNHLLALPLFSACHCCGVTAKGPAFAGPPAENKNKNTTHIVILLFQILIWIIVHVVDGSFPRVRVIGVVTYYITA